MKLKILGLTLMSVLYLSSVALAANLVDAEWLKSNMGNKNVKVMDVADKHDSFGKEHIPGAIHVKRILDTFNTDSYPPTGNPTKDQFEKFLSNSGINKNSIIVAYDDKFGLFATRLLYLLEMYGHDTAKLKLLNGGIVNWKKQGNTVTGAATPIKKSAYKAAKAKSDMSVIWSDIYRDVDQSARPEVLLIDARPENEYKAQNIRAIRGGHLPKAILVTSVEANDMTSHLFKTVDEIKKIYTAKGVNGDRPVYTYCHSGDRSAHTYFILKHVLGYKNVRVYDGGWTEWANMLALPMTGQVWLWDAPKPVKKEEPKK